ncbi:MAG: hypothetical protein GTO45_27840 [Candidatus Aminicenantes bacterium]|nr:hypothetical protein [Candidatus Aminicenantes bacterium]NIM82614.1 hypothetical protein [Candidatus Aminicenantes bacterium]NIN21982.1 hypothetical protein [Candidatus Aminicenantes bacterium]NIN45744.1 hypothetical protein [Candidatus Aminicenantes bacterium]NIN88582.1 hypothetical protein [Candidatus Aminicenantes bacterium]
MKYGIVGGKKEIKKLDEIFASNEAEFLALYGRMSIPGNWLPGKSHQAICSGDNDCGFEKSSEFC